MANKFDVLGVKIDVTNIKEASKIIGKWVEERKKAYILGAHF